MLTMMSFDEAVRLDIVDAVTDAQENHQNAFEAGGNEVAAELAASYAGLLARVTNNEALSENDLADIVAALDQAYSNAMQLCWDESDNVASGMLYDAAIAYDEARQYVEGTYVRLGR